MSKLSPVSYKQLVKVFEAEGFRCVRTEGDHMVFTKPGVIRPVVIPKYASIPVFIIKKQPQNRRYISRTSLRTPRRLNTHPPFSRTQKPIMNTFTLKIS